MRFSLTTLLLVAFWIAALVLVWMRREPWIHDKTARFYLSHTTTEVDHSPDKTRHLQSDTKAGQIFIQDSNHKDESGTYKELWRTSVPEFEIGIHAFVDDETMQVEYYDAKGDYRRRAYRRRFPEWWWGHFYRPEVWLAVVLTAVLAWRGIAAGRMKIGSAALNPTKSA